VKNRWFSKFCKKKKKYETLSFTLKICTLQENGFRELTLFVFFEMKPCFKGYTFCSTTFLVRTSTGTQQSRE
jgi:hypothetical protein